MSHRRTHQVPKRTISTRRHVVNDDEGPATPTPNNQDQMMPLQLSLESIQQQLTMYRDRVEHLERENQRLNELAVLTQAGPSTSSIPTASETLAEVQKQLMSFEKKPSSLEGALMLYEGKTSWEDYVGHLEIVAAANNWSDEYKGKKLAGALRGTALGVVLATVPPEERLNFHSLNTVLKLRFGQQHLALKWQSELQSRRQRPKEPLAEYAMDIERIVRLATPNWPEQCRDEVALHAFLRGLKDQGAKKILLCYGPTTLQDALTRAQLMEEQTPTNDSTISEPECWGCKKKGHLRAKCPNSKQLSRPANVVQLEPEN